MVHGVQHLASAKKSSARGSAAIDLYRDREIDACTVDETIHHYHRAAGELYKFCFSRGGGSHAEFIAGTSTAWPPAQKPSTGGNAPHHDAPVLTIHTGLSCTCVAVMLLPATAMPHHG